MVHRARAGDGGGNGGAVALVEVDRTRAIAEGDGWGDDRAGRIVGAEATDVQRAGGTGLRAEDDVRGRNSAAIGHGESVVAAAVADREFAAVRPE